MQFDWLQQRVVFYDILNQGPKRYLFTTCDLKLIDFHNHFASRYMRKYAQTKTVNCDANEFYHRNASDNCEKQRICRRNTGKCVTT